MGRYQKSKPSKKIRARLEEQTKKRRESWRQGQIQVQKETIETLALGVEELVEKVEEKEKELGETVDHKIELSEVAMDLDEAVGKLSKNLSQEQQRSRDIGDQGLRSFNRVVYEKAALTEQVRVLQYRMAQKDEVVEQQGRDLEDLRSLVGAQNATIRQLGGNVYGGNNRRSNNRGRRGAN